MAKSLGQSLYGLSAEIKKKIRDEIKSAQSALAQEGNKKEDDYWEGLSALAKSCADLIDKAKADFYVPKGTNLEKLAKIPKTKPKRWAALYKKLGSSWIPGSYSKSPFNEAFQERFAPFSHVVNEFKKAQIERKFFLRDPSMGSQPGT